MSSTLDRRVSLVGPASRTRTLPWIVVSCWLLGVSFAFWHFEFRTQRSFTAPGFVMSGDPGQREDAQRWFRNLAGVSASRAVMTVVHVYREGCECNRFTDPHLAEIEARFRTSGVRFIRVERESALAHGIPAWVSSLPAAFVFGADNQLLYFGPYSDAAWCGRSGALVEGVIERTLQGAPSPPPASTSWGCFCESNDERN